MPRRQMIGAAVGAVINLVVLRARGFGLGARCVADLRDTVEPATGAWQHDLRHEHVAPIGKDPVGEDDSARSSDFSSGKHRHVLQPHCTTRLCQTGGKRPTDHCCNMGTLGKPRGSGTPSSATHRKIRILVELVRHGRLSLRQLMTDFAASERTLLRDLQELRHIGTAAGFRIGERSSGDIELLDFEAAGDLATRKNR